MKHTIHKWGSNILSIHEGLGPPNSELFVVPTKKMKFFHEKIICLEKPKMQNKHQNIFFFFWRPNLRGGGGGVRWLGQMPNFFRKWNLRAPLTMFDKKQIFHLNERGLE